MDALLAAFAEALGVAPEEARPALDAALGRLRAALATDGRARLDGVGTFVDDGVNRRFEPDAVLLAAVNGVYAGLAPVSEQPPGPAPESPAVPAAPPLPLSDEPPAEEPPAEEAPAAEAADDTVELTEPTWLNAPPDGGPPENVEAPRDEAPRADEAPLPAEGPSPVEPAPDAFAEETPAPDDDLDTLLASVWALPASPPVTPLTSGTPVEEADFAVVPTPVAHAPAPVDAREDAAYGSEAPPPAPPEAAPPVEAAAPFAATASPPPPPPRRFTPPPPEPRPPGRRRALLLALPLLLLAALAVWLWTQRGPEAPPAVVEAPPAAPAPDTAAIAALPASPDSVLADAAERPDEEPFPGSYDDAPAPSGPPSAAVPRAPAEATPAPPRPAPTQPPAAAELPPGPADLGGLRGGGTVDPDAGGTTWVVNSTSSAEARMQAERYRALGFRSAALPATVGGRRVHRVVVGQFATVEAAERARGGLPDDARPDAWILRLAP